MSQKLTLYLEIHFFPEFQNFPGNHILTGKSHFPENHNSWEVNSHINWFKMVINPKKSWIAEGEGGEEEEEEEKRLIDLLRRR